MIKIRQLQRADLEAYGELCRYCFDMPPEYVPFYTAWVGNSLSHTWGAFSDGRLGAAMWYYPFEMRVGDTFVPMGGVAAVATAPESRNGGLAKMLMSRAHRQMRAEGRPLAALMPFKHQFYARMGYADVFFMHECTLAPDQIAPRDAAPFHARLIDGEREWRTLEELHQKYGAQYFGTVRRNALYWRMRYLASHREIKRVYLIERGQTPAGFVITNLGKDETTGKPRLAVAQAVWTERGALDAILQLLRSHRDQVPKIIWRLPTDTWLYDRLVDPRLEVSVKPKMMLKLVDFRGALEQRSYPADLDAQVLFELRGDDTSPWNDGRWLVRWQGGHARVRHSRSATRVKNVVRTDIQAMAILYSGHRRTADLEAAGMMSLRGDAHQILTAAFPRAVPYIDEWF